MKIFSPILRFHECGISHFRTFFEISRVWNEDFSAVFEISRVGNEDFSAEFVISRVWNEDFSADFDLPTRKSHVLSLPPLKKSSFVPSAPKKVKFCPFRT